MKGDEIHMKIAAVAFTVVLVLWYDISFKVELSSFVSREGDPVFFLVTY